MIAVKLHTATGEALNVQIKTGWHDVTVADYVRLQDKPEAALMQHLTGLTAEQLAGLDNPSALFLSGQLAGFTAFPEAAADVDVEKETVGQFETAKSYLRRFYREGHKNYRAKVLPFIYGLYKAGKVDGKWSNAASMELAREAQEMAADEVIPYAVSVLAKIEAASAKYERLANDPDNAGNDDAGENELEAFGFYPVLHTLAGGDLLKHDAILQLSVKAVYSHLLYLKKLAASQKQEA